MAHWGDWAIPQFNFRTIGEISKRSTLVKIFGDETLRPRECAELSGYNNNVTLGPIAGFLCFLERKFTFSVCHGYIDEFLKNVNVVLGHGEADSKGVVCILKISMARARWKCCFVVV